MKTSLKRAAASFLVALAVSGTARAALPFIEDDYARAIALAKSRSVPVFVEAWAPW